MITYIKNDTRKIKIAPNPFKDLSGKFSMSTSRINEINGLPVVNNEGKFLKTNTPCEKLYRIPGTSKFITPARLPNNNLNTGLNVLADNIYKDEPVYTSDWEIILKNKDKVLLQYLLEYEFGYPIGYLSNRISGNVMQSTKEDKLFFETSESKPRLDGNVTFLDMSNSIEKIHYYVLLAHKAVANTYDDLLDGGNLDAGWYIINEKNKEERELNVISIAMKGNAALNNLNESNSDAMIQMVKVLELSEGIDRNLTKVKSLNAISSYFNKSKENYENFMKAYKLWKDVNTRPRYVAFADLFDYIHIGLVVYSKGKYTWYKTSNNDPSQPFVFDSKSEFVDKFLLSPQHQDNVLLLEEEYKNKMK